MRTLVLLTGVLLVAGCSMNSGDDDGQPGIPGQGSGTTRTYQVGGFTGIDLRGSDDVDVRVGPGYSVRADGDTKLLDRVKIEQVGTTLRIGRTATSGFSWGGKGAKIFVTLPSLVEATIAGSGNMTIDRVTGASFKGSGAGSGTLAVGAVAVDAVHLALDGSGNIKLAGEAKSLEISVDGSGDVEAAGLKAAGAQVSIAGSGSVRAAVDGAAKVSVMGSGDVDLGGKARCETSKMGSGSVRCA